MLTLNSPVSELERVGRVLSGKLKKIGIETIEDLIFYYPFRYEDYSRLGLIAELRAGEVVTIRGRVNLIKNSRSPRKRKNITEAIVEDDSGQIKAVWFNQPWIARNIRAGDEIYLSGKVAGDLFNTYFNSPNYERVSTFVANTARLVPVYSLTEGVTNKQLRFLIKAVINLTDQIVDYLPEPLKSAEKLVDLNWAVKTIHFPADKDSLSKAKRRLSFDELFFPQLWAQLIRRKLKNKQAPIIKFQQKKTQQFIANLSFTLTEDQKKAAWQIITDIGKPEPMNRLLNGDVGSGKTVVAALAAFNVVLNGYQVVFMAPTEILARQHFLTLRRWSGFNKSKLALITRSQHLIGDNNLTKKNFWSEIKNGRAEIIIGTHALIQPEADFSRVGLVVVDEQHRFGVQQRQVLKEKSTSGPHFLSLSATPIPRTLALAAYGDLDISVIRQLPKERKKVITKIVPPDKRQLAYEFIRKQIDGGRQVFVVCPLIDLSDRLGVRSVNSEFEKLDKEIFPDLSIGLIHGRLKSSEKDRAMADFSAGRTKLLVSTAVVEVGVDVPNASVMMIEGAERFGLAQLHQFRGRVGRSQYQSYCFIFSDSASQESLARLNLLTNCYDGFSLAQKDLALRGAGKIYGLEQSGFSGFKIADFSDPVLISRARSAAQKFLNDYKLEDFPAINRQLANYGFVDHLE
ncbi:MAG TPA: ATP-dependent DNA helicase RecG [bacterium]|nr:ATP-dependent DNA helicase RecG [bacterium]